MKIFTLLIAIFTLSTLFSQTEEQSYPKVTYSENGDTLYVFTKEQAQDIEKTYTLYNLLSEIVENNDSEVLICLNLLNDCEDIVSKYETKVYEMRSKIENLDSTINKMEEKSKGKDDIIKTFFREVELLEKKVELKDEEISDLKKQRLWGGVGLGSIIVGLITLLVISN